MNIACMGVMCIHVGKGPCKSVEEREIQRGRDGEREKEREREREREKERERGVIRYETHQP